MFIIFYLLRFLFRVGNHCCNGSFPLTETLTPRIIHKLMCSTNVRDFSAELDRVRGTQLKQPTLKPLSVTHGKAPALVSCLVVIMCDGQERCLIVYRTALCENERERVFMGKLSSEYTDTHNSRTCQQELQWAKMKIWTSKNRCLINSKHFP